MSNQKRQILVTGSAGFIGYHLSSRLCKEGYEVVGIDTINDYYSVQLKIDRLNELKSFSNFKFLTISITDKESLFGLFQSNNFDYVVNLAAQAGVRYSIEKPYKYIDANLIGFINILEACRQYTVKHLIFASSSSVYGGNKKIPFSESDHTDHPVSLYAATKKSNELMGHAYSALYNIPTTGLRFFTVYGPWGRPDMAVFKFTRSILNGEPIKVYNHGKLKRDFTYIDDIVESISRLLNIYPKPASQDHDDPSHSSLAPFAIYNIGNNNPVSLLDFIGKLEDTLEKKAKTELLPMQPGDVYETYADIDQLKELVSFSPVVSLDQGLKHFTEWYKKYYQNG